MSARGGSTLNAAQPQKKQAIANPAQIRKSGAWLFEKYASKPKISVKNSGARKSEPSRTGGVLACCDKERAARIPVAAPHAAKNAIQIKGRNRSDKRHCCHNE
jgi:hypothetical protein